MSACEFGLQAFGNTPYNKAHGHSGLLPPYRYSLLLLHLHQNHGWCCWAAAEELFKRDTVKHTPNRDQVQVLEVYIRSRVLSCSRQYAVCHPRSTTKGTSHPRRKSIPPDQKRTENKKTHTQQKNKIKPNTNKKKTKNEKRKTRENILNKRSISKNKTDEKTLKMVRNNPTNTHLGTKNHFQLFIKNHFAADPRAKRQQQQQQQQWFCGEGKKKNVRTIDQLLLL